MTKQRSTESFFMVWSSDPNQAKKGRFRKYVSTGTPHHTPQPFHNASEPSHNAYGPPHSRLEAKEIRKGSILTLAAWLICANFEPMTPYGYKKATTVNGSHLYSKNRSSGPLYKGPLFPPATSRHHSRYRPRTAGP